MGVGPRALPRRKISGGSRKYRKGVDHRKGEVPLEMGGCKVVQSYEEKQETQVLRAYPDPEEA